MVTFHQQTSITLCASTRLAHQLRLQYQQSQIKRGETQWQSSDFLSLNAWLDEIVEQAILLGEVDANTAPLGVLTPTQEGLLWEQSIQQSLSEHEAAALFNTNGLASAAMEANRYLVEWDIALESEASTEESKQFCQWRKVFRAKCQQKRYLEPVRYMAWQLAQLKTMNIPLPSTITFAGFDRINPHLAKLQNILAAKEVTVKQWQCGDVATTQTLHAYTEQMDECRAAVAWAKTLLAQQPDANIAIVVPELEQLRPTLTSLLDDTFHPETIVPALAEQPRNYECSLGSTFAALPLIATALDLLRVAFLPVKQNQTVFSQLLTNIHWSSSQSEADERAQLEARMRQHLGLNINIFTFAKWLQRMQSAKHPILSPVLCADVDQLIEQVKQAPKWQTPSAWANDFAAALQATQWQGERQLSSTEFQTVERFKKVLQEMHSLEPWLDKLSAAEALQRLSRLCQNTVFQPETTHLPSIFIMGMLETAAQRMDAIWVMGMNDHVWPPLSRTNALIPAELQRRHAMPNASSEVQTAFADTIHQRLLRSADTIHFSYAEEDGEKQLRPSPLMQYLTASVQPETPVQTLAEKLYTQSTQADWEWLNDHQAPRILEGEHISGGTGLIKAQNICPAWAFFQYRLKARGLDEPKEGIDAMERGNLIHAVLAAFWTQHDGITPDEALLTQQLASIAKDVIAEFNEQHQERFSDLFLQLETERLSKLALGWLLTVDADRPTGFSVTACEQENILNIEGIQIKLIVDRIDTLDDGRLVVIDYKTSLNPDYKNWADERLTEPQLPIYAAFVLQDADVAAVCFGQVRSHEHRFIGTAAGEKLLPRVKAFNTDDKTFDAATFPHWQSLLSHWHNSIAATARELKDGDAAIIVEDEKYLAYCDVAPLLRLAERQLQFEQAQTIQT